MSVDGVPPPEPPGAATSTLTPKFEYTARASEAVVAETVRPSSSLVGLKPHVSTFELPAAETTTTPVGYAQWTTAPKSPLRPGEAPAVVDHVGAVRDGVDHRPRQVERQALVRVVDPLERHELAPGRQRRPRRCRCCRPRRWCRRRACRGRCRPCGIAVVVDEVPAVDVVDVAVAVVVDAVARDLAGVGPDVGGEVGVVVVDAGVDDARRRLPRPWRCSRPFPRSP